MPQELSIGITSIGYDPITKSLLIICGSGDAYRYAGVTKEVYEDLISTPSREQFIRDRVQGRYPREKYPCLAVGEEI